MQAQFSISERFFSFFKLVLNLYLMKGQYEKRSRRNGCSRRKGSPRRTPIGMTFDTHTDKELSCNLYPSNLSSFPELNEPHFDNGSLVETILDIKGYMHWRARFYLLFVNEITGPGLVVEIRLCFND